MSLSLNWIDISVLVVILIFVFYGYKKGLILTVFKLVSFFASIALSRYLYPHVSRFLRDTPIYDMLKDLVVSTMGLGDFFQNHANVLLEEQLGGQLQSEWLEGLPIPDVLRNLLVENNTTDIYTLLKVDTIEDYIAGFFANIIVNILAMVLVFILSWVILSLAANVLNLVSHLPIIGTLNRAGGLAVGLLMGVAVAWVGLLVIGILFATPAYPEVYAYTQGSIAAKWFFDSKFVMELITGV